MKNLIILLIFSALWVISTSCEKMFGDFLNKAPGIDITIDTLFSSVTRVEMYLASCYDQGAFCGYPNNNKKVGATEYQIHNSQNSFDWACSTDEGKNPLGWYTSVTWNAGGINVGSSTSIDFDWIPRWNSIRMDYIMIENVDKVPGIDPAYANTIKNEMKFLIAEAYFEHVKRYGGVPIVTKSFGSTERPNQRRSSIDSTFQFIIKNLDEAASVLPDVWVPSSWKGRITRGACLALKAKALIYAASPLFNTATPYLDMADPANNQFICYGNYDVNRWKLAADAAKAVIDWAPSGGIALVTDKGVDKNYKYTWEVMDNTEIIHAEKSNNGGNQTTGYSGMPWSTIYPNPMGGWTGMLVTQTCVEKYYYNRYTGKPIVWYANGNDLNQKYDSMDYRFKQTVAYNGSYWSSNRPVVETFKPNGLHQSYCATGYWMKKFIPDAVTSTSSRIPVNWPYLRLNEMMLYYAEALNEYNASPPQAAYDMVNAIRARSGMINIPTGLTQAQFRDWVQHEEAVEFAWEDHRFWDIRRWMICEQDGVMQGPILALTITKFGTGTPQQFHYERFVLENRVWKRFTYLLPFKSGEVNKGYIVQNPGY